MACLRGVSAARRGGYPRAAYSDFSLSYPSVHRPRVMIKSLLFIWLVATRWYMLSVDLDTLWALLWSGRVWILENFHSNPILLTRLQAGLTQLYLHGVKQTINKKIRRVSLLRKHENLHPSRATAMKTQLLPLGADSFRNNVVIKKVHCAQIVRAKIWLRFQRGITLRPLSKKLSKKWLGEEAFLYFMGSPLSEIMQKSRASRIYRLIRAIATSWALRGPFIVCKIWPMVTWQIFTPNLRNWSRIFSSWSERSAPCDAWRSVSIVTYPKLNLSLVKYFKIHCPKNV